MVNEQARRPRPSRQQLALRVAGAGLLAATGAIHLDLYLTGYRSIPTIGWLFLAQVIAAFVFAAAVLVTGNRLIAAAGAGFAVSTFGGYVLSVWIGLFGFTEVRTTAGIVAGVIEVAGFAALAALALMPAPYGQAAAPGQAAPHGRLARMAPVGVVLAKMQAGVPGAGRGIAGACVLALVLLGVTVGQAGAPAPNAGGGQPPGSGPVLIITIKGFRFEPAAAQALPGQRVEVRNDDAVAHTLSAGPGAKVAGLFGTGQINPGQTRFFVAPKQPGTYPFYCMFHTFMVGTLVVGQAKTTAALTALVLAGPAPPAATCGPRRPVAGRHR